MINHEGATSVFPDTVHIDLSTLVLGPIAQQMYNRQLVACSSKTTTTADALFPADDNGINLADAWQSASGDWVFKEFNDLVGLGISETVASKITLEASKIEDAYEARRYIDEQARKLGFSPEEDEQV